MNVTVTILAVKTLIFTGDILGLGTDNYYYNYAVQQGNSAAILGCANLLQFFLGKFLYNINFKNDNNYDKLCYTGNSCTVCRAPHASWSVSCRCHDR